MFGATTKNKAKAAPTETTALTSGDANVDAAVTQAAAAAAIKEAGGLAGKVMNKENLEQMSKVACERFDEISASLAKGDMSIRVMAVIGGIALAFFAAAGIFSKVIFLNWNAAVMEIYTLILAIVMVLLETPGIKIPDKYRQTLYKYCLFLKYIWGRGIVYFIAGNLQFAQGGIISFIVGAYVMFVGVIFIIVGRSAAKKLSTLKHDLFSDSTLRAKFTKADTKGEGQITLEQFGTLCDDLDLDLTKREKEGIFFHLDASDDNVLTFEEFQGWWKDYDASHSV